ncbi:Oidioi.mRNA.OKI2018_I69.chr1.g3676.t1.cds [Oikopleura dioica]|uniref:Oidioi.mRNA.OKI2018_I69.chr1.g3676.t1.cds n=1 Tax=Oikopleura dioica TaxID=34765 RepID=A0ABN7SUQ0_OIKDI|nr:Oidioi.mRNA.OKI2018_I69.chr1.g3676.t1.cds [Oikopleura dioica]
MQYKSLEEKKKQYVPGGNFLGLMRIFQMLVGCLAWFVPGIIIMENPQLNPLYGTGIFYTFVLAGIISWLLPCFKILSIVPWPISAGPESMICLIAGFFSVLSGIAICIGQNDIQPYILKIALVLNVIHSTILYGTPVVICSQSAFRFFFISDTDLTTMQAFNNMEARERYERDMERASIVKNYEVSEDNHGQSLNISSAGYKKVVVKAEPIFEDMNE